jgi:23S rRNA (uracil1939-C5)-methyltransferase
MSICPIQDRCGGCPAMNIPLDEQRTAHKKRVERLLGIPVSGLTTSPNTEGFRSRIELTPGRDGVLGYRMPRSHESVPVVRCAIARAEINEVLPSIGPVPRFVERVALRSNGAQVMLHAQTKDKHRNKGRAWLEGLTHLGIPLAINGRGIHEDPITILKVAGITHRLSPSTFYQVNLEINEELVADVVAAVEAVSPTAVLDLFSGAGNLSLPLATRGHPVTMIEAHPTATKDARRTAAQHGLDVDIRASKAEDFQAGDVFFDVAIMDPPRKGAGAVIEQVLMTRPKAVVMVSCNPRALASDLRRAKALGYSMDAVHLYEMFPHSQHIEAMGVLSSK